MNESLPLAKLLLVEDDEILGGAVIQRFRLEGFEVTWAKSCATALACMKKEQHDFVLADIRLPDGSGEDLYRQALVYLGETPIVFATAFGEVDQAVRLVRAGADDYLTKPFDMEALVKYIRKRVTAVGHVERFKPFLGAIFAKALAEDMKRLAAADLPLLIRGETGVGKEIMARHLHRMSPRAAKPFIAVNCGALSPSDIERSLFGYVRGAFPGAIGDYAGLLGEANGGVLFLDEIAELAPAWQVALLRVLESGTYRPQGAQRDVTFRGRIAAATKADLRLRVAEHKFREDLFYRLAVVEMTVPPLRERRDEIPELARFFLDEAMERFDKSGMMFLPIAEASLLSHEWPGNMRELRNRIERAVVLSDKAVIEPRDLFPEQILDEKPPQDLKATRLDAERKKIEQALLETQGRLGEAAKKLGVSRTTLWKKLKQTGE